MKKRIIGFITAIVMMLSVLNLTTVNAEVENEAAIGKTEYASLQYAVNDAKDGETITIIKSGEIGGVKVATGKNITIDFNGNIVSIGKPMVGSPGTETNAFQLLKGSNITFKNGTVKTTDQSNAILFQNYSNLTLEDITLDASECSTTQYVLSNNFGNVTIKGNTNIYAYNGQKAFDLYYGLASSGAYDGGRVSNF